MDPQAVDELAKSLSKDLENNNAQLFNHQDCNPSVSGTFAFGRTSSLNFSHSDPAPSQKVITWGDKEDESSIDLKVLERSNVKASSSRMPHYAQEHVLAERKRREKLSRQFLALSTLVPELKKVWNFIEITRYKNLKGFRKEIINGLLFVSIVNFIGIFIKKTNYKRT